jgi:hypothetical protein
MWELGICTIFKGSQTPVASRLALRWAAQQPHESTGIFTEKTQRLILGLLRSPTQGKPARHRQQ